MFMLSRLWLCKQSYYWTRRPCVLNVWHPGIPGASLELAGVNRMLTSEVLSWSLDQCALSWSLFVILQQYASSTVTQACRQAHFCCICACLHSFVLEGPTMVRPAVVSNGVRVRTVQDRPDWAPKGQRGPGGGADQGTRPGRVDPRTLVPTCRKSVRS